jgi:hypothetical protein
VEKYRSIDRGKETQRKRQRGEIEGDRVGRDRREDTERREKRPRYCGGKNEKVKMGNIEERQRRATEQRKREE